jgi:hypothetical protein
MEKMLLGLFFVLAFVYSIHILYEGYKHPGNWSHRDLRFPYGGAAVIVFLLPQIGLLLFSDHFLDGTLQIIVLSILGITILVTVAVLLLDFVRKKRLFKNDR